METPIDLYDDDDRDDSESDGGVVCNKDYKIAPRRDRKANFATMRELVDALQGK